MYLPSLSNKSKSRSIEMEFKGYNHNLYVGSGQFYDTKNLTSKYYPVLSPRTQRAKLRQITTPNGLYAKNKLCWVDGTGFYYDGTLRGTVANSAKQFVGMGARILIFPDKKQYNTETNVFSDLGAAFTAGVGLSITYKLAKLDGTEYGAYTASDTAPTNPLNGAQWMDTSATPNVLKIFATSSSMWTSVATTYVLISATGIGSPFNVGDGVAISGSTVTDLNSSFIIMEKAANYIVVTALLAAAASQTGGLIVTRDIPAMDFVTECNNRVWGCSSLNHEIYACKLGDPTNWKSFQGISTDSYAVTVGSDGNFTGACSYLGNVIFFKEDSVIAIDGSKPANYKLEDKPMRGVESGCEKSLRMLNEKLFYKARDSVCVFDLSLPSLIGRDLGVYEKFSGAVGGAVDGLYYVSMSDASGAWHLFAYDDEKGIWMREDATHAIGFAAVGGDLYMLDSSGWLWSMAGKLTAYAGTGAALESAVEWYAETGDIGIDLPDRKYVSKIQVMARLATGSTMKVYVQYDSSGTWVEKFSISAATSRAYTVPMIPVRCDHMRMKLTGTGTCKVYRVDRIIEQGSEM